MTVAPPGPVASAVIGDGRFNVGGVVSATVTVKLALALLPEPSVAVQMTVVVPTGNELPEGGTHVGVRLPLAVSVALAVNVTWAPPGPVAGTLIGPGTLRTGGVVSWTVTGNELLPVFPWLSVAVHVTVVVPSWNVLPDAGAHVGVRLPSTRSTADTPE